MENHFLFGFLLTLLATLQVFHAFCYAGFLREPTEAEVIKLEKKLEKELEENDRMIFGESKKKT